MKRARTTTFALIVCAAQTLTSQATPSWHLQLDHAIRPIEGTEGVIGDVSSLAVTRSGVVYVAEYKTPRVTRYDAGGKFVTAVMRSGEGPKETREPMITLQGDTLVVFDGMLHRLSRISPTNVVMNSRALNVEAGSTPVATTHDGSILIEAGFDLPGTNRSAARVSPSGRVDTLAWNERFSDQQFVNWMYPGGGILGGPFTAAPSAAFDPTGRIVVGGSRASRWVVLSGKDTVQRVVLPDHPVTIPRAVRDSAWDAFLARFVSNPAIGKALNKNQLPTILPAWVTLDINPRDEWWIGRPGMDGALASWDIIDKGRLVGHVAVPERIVRSVGVYGKTITSDLIALLHEDENAVPWIGVYRIIRK